MRKLMLLSILSVIAWPEKALADQYVDGYTRKDGQYVQPYTRSSPDNTKSNNYGSYNNYNNYDRYKAPVDVQEPSDVSDPYGSNLKPRAHIGRGGNVNIQSDGSFGYQRN